jgi:FtsP/CotA-like multicopper oxidase with cupredoxin domain
MSFAGSGTTASCHAGSLMSSRYRHRGVVCTRTFVFSGRPTLGVPPGVRWVINGEAFDPLRVDVTPRLGDVEVWRFVNRGFVGQTMLHPVHTHLAPFQIRRRNGGAPLRQEAG